MWMFESKIKTISKLSHLKGNFDRDKGNQWPIKKKMVFFFIFFIIVNNLFQSVEFY